MKKILLTSVIIIASMLLIPLGVLSEPEKVLPTTAVVKNTNPDSSLFLKDTEYFRVYDAETNNITEMPKNEYIFGVVAAEMPALYHPEALKAQAVAAYTFALTRKAENKNNKYDITTASSTDQSFISKEAATLKWGEDAPVYIEKIEKAIAETENLVLTYNGKPITAVYHAISSGKTESSADIWGVELPYLIPVASEDDRLAQNYQTEISFSEAELRNLIPEFREAETVSFGQSLKTDSGTVKEIEACGKTISGDELRNLLNLRSANFTVAQSSGVFTFTIYGYGHGVGMSQNGADCMAKKGCGFREILNHYYPNCQIEELK